MKSQETKHQQNILFRMRNPEERKRMTTKKLSPSGDSGVSGDGPFGTTLRRGVARSRRSKSYGISNASRLCSRMGSCKCSIRSGKSDFLFRRSQNNVVRRRRFGQSRKLHLLLHELLLLQNLEQDRGQFSSAALSQWTNWKVAYSIPGFSALSKPPQAKLLNLRFA